MKKRIFLGLMICLLTLTSLSFVSAGWGIFNNEITGNVVNEGLAQRVEKLERIVKQLEKRLDECGCPTTEIEKDDECIKMCDLDALEKCGTECQTNYDICIASEGSTSAPSMELIKECGEEYKNCMLSCDKNHCEIVCKDDEYYICYNKCMNEETFSSAPIIKEKYCMNYCMKTEEIPEEETDYCDKMCEIYEECKSKAEEMTKRCKEKNLEIYEECRVHCENNKHVLERTKFTTCVEYCETQKIDCQRVYENYNNECNKYEVICNKCKEQPIEQPIDEIKDEQPDIALPQESFLRRLFG